MIVPCIDLMGGKVVQLRQGREKVLEGKSPDEMLDLFAGFPEIQVIDLDAAMGVGSNSDILEHLAARAKIRAGGGVRSPEQARRLRDQGAHRIIVGTAAFSEGGPHRELLSSMTDAVGSEILTVALDSRDGHIVVNGWKETTRWTAAALIQELEPYCSSFLCTYVDKEGMMQGTDLAWFADLRSRTAHGLTAAGGITTLADVEALVTLNIDCAIGMSIYTGNLSLSELSRFNPVPR